MSSVQRKHGDYVEAVNKALAKIGKSNGTALPVTNNPLDQPWQEYAIARIVHDWADRRLKTLKEALLPYVDRNVAGPQSVYDSAFVNGGADVRNGAKRIDRAMLLNNLMKKLNMSMEEATAFIALCEKQDANGVTLRAVLKQ